MTKNKFFLIALFLASFIPQSLFAADARSTAALSVNGFVQADQSQDKPLLLTVIASNSAGSARFELKDEKGSAIPFTVRPLPEKNDAVLYFGADPQELSRLTEGAYTLQAFLGSVSSNLVKLRIKKGAPMSADTEGLFYRLDRQYEKLLTHAQGMTARDANAASGWIYQGDALEGLNRDSEALAAYRKALSVSSGKAGSGKLVETPVYIQEKIINLLRKKSGKA